MSSAEELLGLGDLAAVFVVVSAGPVAVGQESQANPAELFGAADAGHVFAGFSVFDD